MTKLNPWSKILLEKLWNAEVFKKFPSVYVTKNVQYPIHKNISKHSDFHGEQLSTSAQLLRYPQRVQYQSLRNIIDRILVILKGCTINLIVCGKYCTLLIH
jgi:hypothetical protein